MDEEMANGAEDKDDTMTEAERVIQKQQ